LISRSVMSGWLRGITLMVCFVTVEDRVGRERSLSEPGGDHGGYRAEGSP
jgi:hypothetical protein